jgi:hypothetical protein
MEILLLWLGKVNLMLTATLKISWDKLICITIPLGLLFGSVMTQVSMVS